MKHLSKYGWLVVAILMAGCDSNAETESVPVRPALVMEVGGQAAKLAGDVVLVGEVKSRYESIQSFRIGGKIIMRKAEVGDIVKKGQVLARLDPTDNQLTTQAANADVLSAQANYDLAKAEVERQRQLLQQQFISQSALDLQEARLKTSEAALKQAKARAAVSSNQARYTALVADRSGVIADIQAEPGQVVSPGQAIAIIADLKQLEVLAAVPESQMEKIKMHDLVGVRLWAKPEKLYQGKVREIYPAASEATRAFDVRFAITDADEEVKLGMTAGVKFANALENMIRVPSTAVTEKDGQKIVWVIDDQQVAHHRPVEIGPFSEQGVIVKQGLHNGEVVAIAGVHTLVDGQKVQPRFENRKQ